MSYWNDYYKKNAERIKEKQRNRYASLNEDEKKKLLNSFKNEGVTFSEIFIDRSFPNDNASTRKPRTCMLTNYLDNSEYNLSESYVIGDRISDMELAKNLNSKGILINIDNIKLKEETKNDFDEIISLKTNSWSEIYSHLKLKDRVVKTKRKTNRNTQQTHIHGVMERQEKQ